MSIPEPDGTGDPARHVLQRGVRPVPDLRVPESSVRSVARVAKTDGRTTVRAYRRAGGVWCLPRRRTWFTHDEITRMRDAGIAEVVLRRRLRRVSLLLSWIP